MSTRIDRSRSAIVVVTVEREHVRNAYDPPTLHQLADVITSCTSDGTRALVLTGGGDVSFSSGMDLRALRSEKSEVIAAAVAAFNEALDSPDRLPVIAALNGDAVGGGMEVALRCDLVVAADDCFLRLPEVEHGLIPGGGGTLLSSRIPIAVAMEVGILGAPMSSARAYELGLVNRLVARNDVVSTAVMLAEQIARNGPRAVAVTRRLLWVSAREGAAAGWEQTQAATKDAALREEMAEGVAAFIDKRAPVWSIR